MIKTEKEDWACPDMQVQLFVPQDCVAACQPITRSMVRYLDYLEEFGEYNDGEEISRWGTVNANEAKKYENVKGYNYRIRHQEDWFNVWYEYSTPVYQGVVDIRQEGPWWRPQYVPYNATS